jgi:drug/metabolite transporter (DMT)-like permease
LTGYTVPIVAVLLAVIFLGEEITAAIVVGAVLIIGGVVLSERGTSHVPEPGVVISR